MTGSDPDIADLRGRVTDIVHQLRDQWGTYCQTRARLEQDLVATICRLRDAFSSADAFAEYVMRDPALSFLPARVRRALPGLPAAYRAVQTRAQVAMPDCLERLTDVSLGYLQYAADIEQADPEQLAALVSLTRRARRRWFKAQLARPDSDEPASVLPVAAAEACGARVLQGRLQSVLDTMRALQTGPIGEVTCQQRETLLLLTDRIIEVVEAVSDRLMQETV